MRYINIKTGAIIDSPSKIISKNWIVQEVEVEEIDEEEVDEIKSFDEINIEQIKEELDFLGIEYNSKAKKQELYDLMIQGR